MTSVPFIFVSDPQPIYSGDSPEPFTHGHHAYFVTHVPFIPRFQSDDFIGTASTNRIKLINERQLRFLNDLISRYTPITYAETLELRLVSIPQPKKPTSAISIFLIGKYFDSDKQVAINKAIEFWQRITSSFPSEDPFNYPLQTIYEHEVGTGLSYLNHKEALFQLALDPFEGKRNLHYIDIQKYEDFDPQFSQSKHDEIGFFPHPFRPSTDVSAMSRFLETFAQQKQRCVVCVRLRPTSLSADEYRLINTSLQRYHNLMVGKDIEPSMRYHQYQHRYERLKQVYEPLINQQNHLFLLKLQIIGEQSAPIDVATSLGSEIMNNIDDQPHLWKEVIAQTNADVKIAYRNFDLLDYQPMSSQQRATPHLTRILSLATSQEALGAFRLPIPPESGYMPGILVRDEPFVMESGAQYQITDDTAISIGNVIHRGMVTENEFLISIEQIKRHLMVVGSTGSGKTNTCLHLLSQLWDKNIPFLILYPLNKPDYRQLFADSRLAHDILCFTLGDDTVSPFRFNPFAVSDGVLIRSHISLLMRAFKAAFSLWDPLPSVYREALYETYRRAGYTDFSTARGGDSGKSYPLFSDFYRVLTETSQRMTRDYGQEARGNIRQGAEIRIHDLIQNLGHVMNVREGVDWHTILKYPTIMELGRVGSTEDTALVMGFLLMSLVSYLSSRHPEDAHQHITLIEEAHRLMPAHNPNATAFTGDARGQASEDFANLLAEVRGFDESIIIAEQTPTELVNSAIANTFIKIEHWLEEQSSFELFADIMNLTQQQREYTRTLPTGHAILRGASGRPVLVKIPNYLDRIKKDAYTLSDEAIQQKMRVQLDVHHIHIPAHIPIDGLFDDPKPTAPHVMASSCAYCHWIHQKPLCHYRKHVDDMLAHPEFETHFHNPLLDIFNETVSSKRLSHLNKLAKKIYTVLTIDAVSDRLNSVRCYIAHKALEYATTLESTQLDEFHLFIVQFLNTDNQFVLET